MVRPVPDIAVRFVADKEELRLTSYRDLGGVWTIGYGHTGADIGPNHTVTPKTADAYLRSDLETAAQRLHARIGDVVDELTEHQYAALLSFVFNLGANASWTIWKVLKARQFDQVPVQMMRFVYAGGKKRDGLVNRRAAEVVLWSTDEPGSTAETPSSGVTREVETPPAPMAKPLAQSKSFVTTAVAAAASAPVAVKQVNDAIAPYAGQSETVAKVVAVLATLAALLAVIALVLQWMKHRSAQR